MNPIWRSTHIVLRQTLKVAPAVELVTSMKASAKLPESSEQSSPRISLILRSSVQTSDHLKKRSQSCTSTLSLRDFGHSDRGHFGESASNPRWAQPVLFRESPKQHRSTIRRQHRRALADVSANSRPRKSSGVRHVSKGPNYRTAKSTSRGRMLPATETNRVVNPRLLLNRESESFGPRF